MTLGQKQRLFSRLISELVLWIYDQGYEVTDGDAYRDPRIHGKFGESGGYGRASSCHKVRLARDYNLFKDGEWLQETEDHAFIGEKWESMHELCRWGGRFKDGNHYSFEHEGNR
jgi:hypothetical protein